MCESRSSLDGGGSPRRSYLSEELKAEHGFARQSGRKGIPGRGGGKDKGREVGTGSANLSGPETRLLYLESNKTPRPGLQELVLDPKGNGRL